MNFWKDPACCDATSQFARFERMRLRVELDEAAFAGAEALRFVVNVGPNVATIADLAQHLLQDFELSDFAPALRIELASPEGGFVLFPSQLVADVLQPNDLIR